MQISGGKVTLERGNSKGKGSELVDGLVCSRDRKRVGVAKAWCELRREDIDPKSTERLLEHPGVENKTKQSLKRSLDSNHV